MTYAARRARVDVRLASHGRALLRRVAEAGVGRGLDPRWVGYRHVLHETVPQYFARHRYAPAAGRFESIHAPATARNPLPRNVGASDALPQERGWWGYAFADVPSRPGGETFIATLPDCRVAWYRDPARDNDFHPAILTSDGRALDMREIRFRPPHAEVLRRARAAPVQRAVWILERVYHNHSHWLTAHLPKMLLLRDRGELADVLLPPEPTPTMEASLRMLGLDAGSFATFDQARPLHVGELTIVGTDRFRPELLRMVASAFGVNRPAPAWRRVFISRARAPRRRLVNEAEVWAALRRSGFERVCMEELTFAEQVALMRETAVLAAPHGAGLTNMLFCRAGADVIELADLTFPNPNFYALASALGHRYWLIPAEGLGDAHPVDKDLRADARSLRGCLAQLEAPTGGGE